MLLLILVVAHVNISAVTRNCVEFTDVGGVQPILYNVDLTFSGLRDADRDSNRKFWVRGKVDITTKSQVSLCNVVLHAGKSEHLIVTKKVFEYNYFC